MGGPGQHGGPTWHSHTSRLTDLWAAREGSLLPGSRTELQLCPSTCPTYRSTCTEGSICIEVGSTVTTRKRQSVWRSQKVAELIKWSAWNGCGEKSCHISLLYVTPIPQHFPETKSLRKQSNSHVQFLVLLLAGHLLEKTAFLNPCPATSTTLIPWYRSPLVPVSRFSSRRHARYQESLFVSAKPASFSSHLTHWGWRTF